jgi:hypothetical protein
VWRVDVEDVGPLPTLPPPGAGERIHIEVMSRPPVKTIGKSMRNPDSPQRPYFMALRHAAIAAMGGRKWYEGPIGLRLHYTAPKEGMSAGLFPFMSGIMDTLDGCQGPSIMYLPIVYLDDSQVIKGDMEWTEGDTESYELDIEFM